MIIIGGGKQLCVLSPQDFLARPPPSFCLLPNNSFPQNFEAWEINRLWAKTLSALFLLCLSLALSPRVQACGGMSELEVKCSKEMEITDELVIQYYTCLKKKFQEQRKLLFTVFPPLKRNCAPTAWKSLLTLTFLRCCRDKIYDSHVFISPPPKSASLLWRHVQK